MFLDIDLSLATQKPKLSLCKPNKTKICNLPEAYYPNLEINISDLDTLSFSLPYHITKNHQLQRNPHISQLHNRYLIKLILGDYIQWFIITSPIPTSDDDSDFLEVNCVSLENELNNKRVRNFTWNAVKLSELMNGYSRDTTINNITTTNTVDGLLKGTLWTLGNVPTSIETIYRSFEGITSTKLDFIRKNICDKYKLISKFDTANRVINFYETEAFGENDGLKITDKNYLRTITQTEDDEDFCTRLNVYGKDSLSIQKINPINKPFIEDYSYFLYPFIRDDERNVIVSSNWMTDELCHAILDYKDALSQNAIGHTQLLEQLSVLQIELTNLENEMTLLTDAMKEIDDLIEDAQSNGQSTTTLVAEKEILQASIDGPNGLQSEIDAKQLEITGINEQITTMQTELSETNHFSPELLIEKIPFEIEKEWTDETYTLDTDLYFAALDEIIDRKIPQTLIEISIVNFLEVISEQRNHKKIVVGNKVAIVQEQLGINVITTITKASFDFENAEMKLTISDVKKSKTARDKIADFLYRTDSFAEVIDINQTRWNESLVNATEYVDQQIQEMTGTLLNLNIDINRFGADGYITAMEAKTLKLTLDKAIAESTDIINTATQLEFLDLPDVNEKTNYQVALNELQTYLIAEWIGPTDPSLTYPIAIISDSSPFDERIKITNLFKDVEDKKSILINAIGETRQDDGKRYVEDQVTELNTALSEFQLKVNEYIEAGEITQTESITLSGLFTDVQTESNDVVSIADELLVIIGDDNVLYDSLRIARNAYYSVDRTSGAIHDVLTEIDDWFNKSDDSIDISRSKGINVNKKISKVETTKETLTSIITQVQIDNELTLVDQQLFEVNVAIDSLYSNIKSFALDNYITYDESVSLKESFDNVVAESANVIDIANSMSVSPTLINAYQNAIGINEPYDLNSLRVELVKWVDLPLANYADKGFKITSSQRKVFLNKFKLVTSTKIALNNAIVLATPEYSVDGEMYIKGTGANRTSNSDRVLKINKKIISDSSTQEPGLMLTVISRENLSVIFTQIYETYSSDDNRNALATKLNELCDNVTGLFGDKVIVALSSHTSIGWNQTLLDAMIRCGGTGTDTGNGKFPFAFIGIPGLFKGSGLEVFSDAGTKSPFAEISTKITDGIPQGIAVGTTVISAQATLAVKTAESGKITAMVDINKIAENDTVTKDEKKTVKKYYDAIVNEKLSIETQASYYTNPNHDPVYQEVIDTLASYEIAYNNFISYVSPILTYMNDSYIINTSNFIGNFTSYYDAKINLLKAIKKVAMDYIGDATVGLAESLINLALEINDAFSDSKIDIKEAGKLDIDLRSVIAESEPLIALADELGLIEPGPNERTIYKTALDTLSALLNTWIGKDSTFYPCDITATEKENVQLYFENVQSSKSTLINKLSKLQISNSNMSIATTLKLFVDTLYSADTTNFSSQGIVGADYKIECWFYGYAPLLTGNLPSSAWETTVIRNYHLGDLFYDVTTGDAYRFSYILSAYEWTKITTTNVDATAVLSDASKSLGSLDSLRRIFVATPLPPYSIEDLWRQSNGDLKICIVERLTGSYVSTEWISSTEYANDIATNIAKAIANKASVDAVTALEDLADIADDNKIKKREKIRTLKPIWDSIVAEYPNYHGQAEVYTSSEMTTADLWYSQMYDALDEHLNVFIGASPNTTPILGYSGEGLVKDSIIARDYFNTKFNDYYQARNDLQLLITNSGKTYVGNTLNDFKVAVVDPLQSQIDGKIEVYFSGYHPYSTNSPANKWNNNKIRNAHLGDLFYTTNNTVPPTNTGLAYEYTFVEPSTYYWKQIYDTDTIDALFTASIASDTSDGIRRVFTMIPPLTPTPPYGIGDMWSQGTAGDLMACVIKKSDGASYVSTDWIKSSKYTDDTVANIAYAEIVDVSRDTTFSPQEKKVIKPMWDTIIGEKVSLDSQADLYSISRTSYDNYHTILNNYLTPLMANLTTKSTIVSADFKANFKNYYDAKTALLNSVTSAQNTNTNNAQSTANTAITNAATANSLLTSMADDNKITPTEKKALLKEWNIISGEYASIYSQGTNYYMYAERDAYGIARTNLYNYLYVISPAPLATVNLNAITTVDGPTFRGKFTDYYNAKITLLNKIAAKISVSEIFIPLYYPDHKSYVGNAINTSYSLVAMGSSIMTLDTSKTIANLLYTIPSTYPTGTKFALDATVSCSSSNSGTVQLFDYDTLYAPYGTSYMYFNVSGTDPIKMRTSSQVLLPGTKLAIGMISSSSNYSIKLYRADLIVIPPT